jgi:hypothetical protein
MNIKKNTSLNESIIILGEKIVQTRHFNDFSEMVSDLIRAKAEEMGITLAPGEIEAFRDQISGPKKPTALKDNTARTEASGKIPVAAHIEKIHQSQSGKLKPQSPKLKNRRGASSTTH